MEGAVGIAHGEATEWGRRMDYHASTVAAIAAGLTAAAAHEAMAARIRGEVAATTEEARLTQEAIACKEAEVKALEEALAQERARKEAEERAHAKGTAKAQADAAKKDAIEAARRRVTEEKAKTEAELAALEAEKARLQQAPEAEAARAREEAKGRAAAATAAAMEEAEAKLRRETPPGGSRVEPFRKLFEGDASSKMTLNEADTSCRPHSAQSQLARARAAGMVTGPHACTPRTHSEWVVGPWPHARKDEWSGMGERPTPDAPHPWKRRLTWAPSCRPLSAQSQLARARAVGLVTGPHTRTPRIDSQWVVGPGRTPERTSGQGWESARPRTPHTMARGAPPEHPHATPIARKASSQERALWGW